VSTDPQEDNTSLGEQEEAGKQFCKENGLIVGIIHREVFSGYQYREREKLDLVRHRYREGKIQGVVIRTLDRLSRSQVHNAILMEEMEHYKITLYCIKENIDDTPMGKFVRMILAFVAEMEREKIMDRTTTGRINKAKEGKIVSGSKAPYGWNWLYSEDGNKTIVLNEGQTVVMQWLAEQYANGVTANNLKNQLNDKNPPAEGTAACKLMQQLDNMDLPWPPPSPKDVKWSDTSIMRLLSDPRITGTGAKIFAYQKRKTKQPLEPIDLPDGTYPAIISQELFDRITERRKINKAYSIRASRQPKEYLLRAGFIHCGYCTKPMMAVKHREKHIYRCTHTDMGHTNAILSKPLDAQIWKWLQRLSDHITIIEKAVELATSNTKIQQDTQAIEHSITRWKAKAKNYLTDLNDDKLIGDTRTAIRNELNNANKMISQLKAEQSQLIAGMIDKEREKKAYQDILDWCKKVKASREEMTYQQKRDFLGMLGVVVIVHNKKPYYEHMLYHTEITLPTIQELIATPNSVNYNTSSGDGVGSPLG
jgi:site-specific DNA recombinase